MTGAIVRCRFRPPTRSTSAVERRVAADGARSIWTEPVSRVARMLALAHHVERLVEAGELTGYAEAARSLGLTRARLTQVMGLLLLAPEIQERLLVGQVQVTERRLRCVVAEPDWNQQLALCARASGNTRRRRNKKR